MVFPPGAGTSRSFGAEANPLFVVVQSVLLPSILRHAASQRCCLGCHTGGLRFGVGVALAPGAREDGGMIVAHASRRQQHPNNAAPRADVGLGLFC